MDTLVIIKQLAIIIIFAKVFGLAARKLKAPQVAGEIIAGLIIGPSILNWVEINGFLEGMAEIGVIMLMFNAGLGTNINDLKKKYKQLFETIGLIAFVYETNDVSILM